MAAFPASLSGKPVTGRFFDQTRNSPYNHTTVGVSLKTSVYSKPRISGCCFHSSGFLLCRMFCTQTGRMSGIRRSRPSSCCSLKCWNLKSLHASWYHFLLFSYRGHNTPNLNEIIPYDFLLCNGFYCRDAGKSVTEIHFFQPNRLTAYKISRAMHMHGLSPHILYKANDHIMMSSRNLSVPDFYEFWKDSRSTSFKKGVFSCRQTRYGAWYAP